MPKKNNGEPVPEPGYPVELDLATATARQFGEAQEKFSDWALAQPPLGPLSLGSGVHNVSPLPMSLEFLRRNASNRPPSLAKVKQLWWSMGHDDWRLTGQGLVFDKDGKMIEGGQRSWASFLGKLSYTTYIVTDIPVDPEIFAYMDDGKPRTAGDALSASGLDGIATHVAAAAYLAYRYELEAIGIFKQPKIRKLNTREILKYSQTHPELTDVGHLLPAYGRAVSCIGHKAVAIVFSDLVIRLHGQDVLDKFLLSLGSGANLPENSPILGLRNRFLSDDDIKKERAFALLNKAFNYHIQDRPLPKSGLSVRDNEKFPRILLPQELSAITPENGD